ncbi:MAG TPA: peptide chain release factor N(5)-glutamine methyltransferase [Acidobacteriota bacterium]|nr:peptide chain release factor N(5)-glutamine methyltransferase [Acidobacteriota bacterium]
MTTIRQALVEATETLRRAGLRSPRADAELILTSLLSANRAHLLAHPEQRLEPSQEKLFCQWLEKRKEHFPLQYLRGRQEFYGRDFEVSPAVLVPRPETELLLEACLRRLSPLPDRPLQVVEVGLGSGCLGETLILEDPRVILTGIDISPAALQVANRNALRLGAGSRLRMVAADALSALARRPFFDLLVSNPPYGALSQSHLVDEGVRRYEPACAVFAGDSGLEVYEKIFSQAARILKPGAGVLVELGKDLRPWVEESARRQGWRPIQVIPDLAGIDRVAEFEPVRPRNGGNPD